MNCATTSDVTRWRNRENVVKVAAERDRVVWRALWGWKNRWASSAKLFSLESDERVHRRKKEVCDQKIYLETSGPGDVFPSVLG